MGVNRQGSARLHVRRRSSSFNTALQVGLDVVELEVFLCDVIQRFSADKELYQVASSKCARLVDNSKVNGLESCSDELANILSVLSTFLSTSNDSLPPMVVFEVHFHVGLIRESQRDYDGAIPSYLKALWIASATDGFPNDRLALTLHSLGRSYGCHGDFHKARRLLQKALTTYEEMQLHRDHPCMIDARASLKDNEYRYWATDVSECWSSWRLDTRLALIEE